MATVESIDRVLGVDCVVWLDAVHEGRWREAELAMRAIDYSLDQRLTLTRP